jgi:hypothetical protein
MVCILISRYIKKYRTRSYLYREYISHNCFTHNKHILKNVFTHYPNTNLKMLFTKYQSLFKTFSVASLNTINSFVYCLMHHLEFGKNAFKLQIIFGIIRFWWWRKGRCVRNHLVSYILVIIKLSYHEAKNHRKK